MKVKAVIWKPDRTNDVIILRKKQRDGRAFTHGTSTYLLHPDRFQVTWTGWRPFRRYYTTFYYTEGEPQPLAVPNPRLRDGKAGARNISSEDLTSIFNPWLYRTISAHAQNIWEQIEFWATVGIALGVVYIIFALSTGNYQLPDIPVDAPTPTPTPTRSIGA